MTSKKFNPQFLDQIRTNTSLPDMVYRAIHDSIICGRIEPGEPLRQLDLAAELGVSARTVREALSRLVAEGLATYEPHRGVRVASFTIEDQAELYRMRAIIEGMAFEEAAAHITEEELDHLREIMHLATQGTDPQSAERARHYNQDFHWTVIRASGKHMYILILEQIWKLMFTYFVSYHPNEDPQSDARELDVVTHKAIIEALSARDGKRARALLEEHIDITFKFQRQEMGEEAASGSGSNPNNNGS